MKNTISRRNFLRTVGSFGALMYAGGDVFGIGNQKQSNVLIIGDSISIGYTPFVKELLDKKAFVWHPDENCEGTTKGVLKVKEWLGDTKWDIIHFNFGLHDLKHVDAKTGVPTTKPEDPRQADVEQYSKNLKIIIPILKASGAKLIFATTTPVPEKSSPLREPEQVIIYNKAALKIMKKEGIVVNDLYEFALPKIKEIQLPNNVHFTPDGYRALAGKVSDSILKKL
jgi:lysophospholipase L1-like esterase